VIRKVPIFNRAAKALTGGREQLQEDGLNEVSIGGSVRSGICRKDVKLMPEPKKVGLDILLVIASQ
jgi:hypothetical protein